MSKVKRAAVVERYLYQLWLELLEAGVVNPITGKHHECKVRKTRARGFAKCDKCENLNAKAGAAETNEEMEIHHEALREHHESVRQDRIEVAPNCAALQM